MIQQATANRSKSINQPSATNVTIKRKVGYSLIDDEMQKTRNKMNNMNMNDR
jgi:hypothetical protein